MNDEGKENGGLEAAGYEPVGLGLRNDVDSALDVFDGVGVGWVIPALEPLPGDQANGVGVFGKGIADPCPEARQIFSVDRRRFDDLTDDRFPDRIE